MRRETPQASRPELQVDPQDGNVDMPCKGEANSDAIEMRWRNVATRL